jgi:hypothetical protein
MMSQEAESTLERIRRVRHEISAEFGHDPYKLVEHYMRLQERYRDRLVATPEPERSGQSAA